MKTKEQLAEEYASDFDYLYVPAKDGFLAGYEAAMDRAKVLEEALERYSKCILGCRNIAIEALSKWKGET